MRFQRLRLLAFGHFTDVDIDLGADPALHLLYGPNESGKSTALRAVTGLLYGIPVTTTDAHLHKMPDLRIGAVLSQNGSLLDVVRRKGNTNTLLDADGGAPVPEAALRAMLGGVDESTFRAMFGLDHVALRHGAESLLSGGGSVGETLFDAGLSGRGIQQVLSELRKEADDLYRPRGQRQAVNEALRRFKQARERRTEESVRPDAWVSQMEELERARGDSTQAGERRRELVAEQNGLQRALRVLPMLTKRRGLLDRRAGLGEVVLLAPDAVSRRVGVQRRLDELGRDSRHHGDGIAELQAKLSSLDVPEGLAGLDTTLVEEIYGRLGQHRKALIDLPKRAAELRVLETEVGRLASTVGLATDAGDLEKARVVVSVQARVNSLAKQRVALDTSVADLRHRLSERVATLGDLKDRAETLSSSHAPDGRALEAAVDEARSNAELPGRIERLAAEISSLERQLEEEVAKLAPWSGDAASLSRIALPSPETVDRFARELDALGSARTEIVRRRRDVERQLAENQKERRAQEELGAPPSEAELREARERRDRGWRGIKDDGGVVPEADADAFERALLEADEIADRLRREADRVAAVANLLAGAEYLEQQLQTVGRDDEETTRREEELSERWRTVWSGIGFDPKPPAEMRDWLARSVLILREWERLRGLTDERALLGARLDERHRELAGCMRDAGEEVPRETGLNELARRARELCESWGDRRREHEEAQRSVAALEAEITRERRALEQKETQLAEWKIEWDASVGALGLSGESSTEEALAVLEGMVTLAGKIDEMETMRARVSAIELDIETFRKDVDDLVRKASPALLKLDTAQAAERLFQLHQRAMNDLDTRREIEESVEAKSEQLRRLAEDREIADRELQSLMADAGAPDVASLTLAEDRSVDASTINTAIAETERELLAAGEGADVEQLLAQTEGLDVDGARARLYELGGEIEALSEQIDRLGREIGAKESGLAGLENERGAAAAAAEEQESLADLSSRVRRYVRVKLAAEILESEVERYRQHNQGPILGRANAYFPRLTLDSYRELRVGYDAKDQEVLRCVRKDGSEVDIEALSDGTRDQLYLALRLATLEHFAEGHEPLPLVLDDVFIHFDDDRARAALEALGAFAENTQILFFTHHTRLVELAREVVPDQRRVEHNLSKLSGSRALPAG